MSCWSFAGHDALAKCIRYRLFIVYSIQETTVSTKIGNDNFLAYSKFSHDGTGETIPTPFHSKYYDAPYTSSPPRLARYTRTLPYCPSTLFSGLFHDT